MPTIQAAILGRGTAGQQNKTGQHGDDMRNDASHAYCQLPTRTTIVWASHYRVCNARGKRSRHACRQHNNNCHRDAPRVAGAMCASHRRHQLVPRALLRLSQCLVVRHTTVLLVGAVHSGATRLVQLLGRVLRWAAALCHSHNRQHVFRHARVLVHAVGCRPSVPDTSTLLNPPRAYGLSCAAHTHRVMKGSCWRCCFVCCALG